MTNTPYVDDRYIFNEKTGKIHHNGAELPATKELMQESKKQLECSKKIDAWISLPNDDIKKTICLYAILDQNLFYDHLSNYDKKRLADTLTEMSKDDKNFEQENINFFTNISNFIMKNIESTKTFIEEEQDIVLANLSEEFYKFNEEKFNIKENQTKRSNI